MGYGVLCIEGKENVCSAGEDCEAGYLDGWGVLSWRRYEHWELD